MSANFLCQRYYFDCNCFPPLENNPFDSIPTLLTIQPTLSLSLSRSLSYQSIHPVTHDQD